MSSQQPLVLGIRREDKNRWERRAPLAPVHVKELAKRGIKVLVQPSSLRTFSDRLYEQAGAIITEDISEASTIICVKEVPIDKFMPNKTYLFFSHTIKAQQNNMKMLDEILAKHVRMIDYETITDPSGARLVRFGKFAGYAGMIDTFHALGDKLLALGHSTPFLHVGYSYCYSSLETAKEAVREMGDELAHYGLPNDLIPLTFVFTSSGNVSQGAQEIFKLLPHKMVTPDEMVDLVKHKEKASPFMVYGTVMDAEHFIEPNDPSVKFDKKEYYATPSNYHSVFFEKYAPYVNTIINCMYWDARFPRILTIKQMQELVEQNRSRLVAVGDISCDRLGSIEFLLKTTSIDQPLFVYNPLTHELHDSSTDHDFIYKPGVVFIAVDNFPTEFPKEATQYFGDHLLPFIEPILKSDASKPFVEQTDLPPEIHKAVITAHGHLTPRFTYITEIRAINEKTLRTILLLGAGYVSGPVVEYLSRNPKNYITVADRYLELAANLCKGKKGNCTPTAVDVTNSKEVEDLVSAHTIVITLLPNVFNVMIAEICLKHKKNLVTASYIPPKMKEMDESVKAEGLIFLNEIGLDPGIDHLEAIRVIDEIHQKGGKVRSFVSWCGGLPLPEFSQNPFGYKFSWSPRGVLAAATKDAKYLLEGKIVEVPGKELYRHRQPLNIFPGFNLEGVPNRDATAYISQYGLEGEIKTMFRGTLRYGGFGESMEAIVEIGLLDESPQPFLAPDAPDISWNNVLRKLLNISNPNVSTRHGLRNRLTAMGGFPSKGFDGDKIHRILDCFSWLGLFSDKLVVKKGTYIDSLCELMHEMMKYEPHEKDLIFLFHMFGVEWPDGRLEMHTSALTERGDRNASAMGRTVGLPVAISCELILSGLVKQRGVVGPMSSEIYVPLLKTLANEGIQFIHKSKPVDYLD